ncbi:MAG: zinc ribbon domain-containing protein [Burkholderiales bacterium]|nr:zinc ribbon domain-containing protein [Burkholderiales bacterium]
MSFLERLFGGNHHRGGGHGSGHHGGYRHAGSYEERAASPGPMTELICQGCGATSGPGARFCSQCGGSLAQTQCSGCRAQLQAGAKFCPRCGKAT